ncbi:MAG: hypothetical protein Q9195_002426 [Heterodermia aff. obscurata]
MPSFGVPDRGAASSPALAPKPPQPSQQPQTQGQDGVNVRPMRLKVLYTFDDQNKTNCLARWPQALDIRTAYLDESQQIGVIELKTCLQAIVSASPELVAKLGQDYTVYAYDYSEYETPLVGQGMLSWILASCSSTPSAPAHQTKTMVTGRVCKNILGLFTSASQETLEVKLRLVPVPTCLQSEYVENMKKYSDISKIIPNGFDYASWTSFLQSNPAIMQLANASRSQTPALGSSQREGSGIEHVQRLLSQGSTSFQSGDLPLGLQTTNAFGGPGGGQLPRPSSPAMSVQSTTAPKRRGRPPKVGPKAKPNSAAPQRQPLVRQETLENGSEQNDDRLEEGPSRKRAKVTKADVPDGSTFAQQPESLRVAASTAASLRIHQPSAIRPSTDIASSLEAPPRVPTPIANPLSQPRRPALTTARSSLRQEPLAVDESTYESPYPPSENGAKPLESVMTSPAASRADSLGETPADITSSPPVYRNMSTAPSSPRLPVLPRDFDSGFMSGSLDDLFGDDELRPVDEEDLEIAAQYCKRSDLPSVTIDNPGSMDETIAQDCKSSDLPSVPIDNSESMDQPIAQPQTIDSVPADERAMAISRQSARNAVGLGRTASSGSVPRPSAIASDPVRPSGLSRSQSWTGSPKQHSPSDIPISDENDAQQAKRARRGSGAEAQIKKEKIRTKLATAIAAGELPPYCDNCGAIETPSWRKAWAKVYSGTPQYVRVSDEEGAIFAWQKLQTDEKGTVCLYRVFKKILRSDDEGYIEILLCNPCGLHLNKRKCMRPKENWEKAQTDSDRRRKRSKQPKEARRDSLPTDPGSERSKARSDHQSQASSPPPGPTDVAADEASHQTSPQLPVFRKPRALSVQMSPFNRKTGLPDASAALALQRAIQSSPARVVGTQNAPIDVEQLTPKPTRRLLFPSPRPTPEITESAPDILSSASASNDANPHSQHGTVSNNQDQNNKENRPPPTEDEGLNPRPTTPTPTNTSHGSVTFKTPKTTSTPHRPPPTTGDFFSSTAKALLGHPSTPHRNARSFSNQPLSEVSPFTAHVNQLFSEANGSPAADFDFPSLPSLHNTPGRTFDSYSFSHLDSQDFFSTDAPMPSSPPVWFGVYEDPDEQETNDLFNDYQTPGNADVTKASEATKMPGLISEQGQAGVDAGTLA